MMTPQSLRGKAHNTLCDTLFPAELNVVTTRPTATPHWQRSETDTVRPDTPGEQTRSRPASPSIETRARQSHCTKPPHSRGTERKDSL
jgi:hypothetical protein